MSAPLIHDQDGLTELFEYLDALRESGATNMYGAGSYLRDAFDLERRDAGAVLSAWMGTFDREARASDRAALALAKQEPNP